MVVHTPQQLTSAGRATRAAAGSLLEMALALERLASALESHNACPLTEAFLVDVVTAAPRLFPGTVRLAADHDELPAASRRLAERARGLRADVEQLLHRLDEHLQLADHLTYEAYATDLGEGA